MPRRATSRHLLTVSEAAARLGVHYQTLRIWADTGKLPCVRVGGKRRFDPAAVEALALARERGYAAVGVEAFADGQGGAVMPEFSGGVEPLAKDLAVPLTNAPANERGVD